MNHEQWSKTYGELSDYYKRFATHYPNYIKGKNKKIRSDAEREMRAAMHGATFTVKNNSEIRELLTSDPTLFGRVIAFDEFKDPRYFQQDMPNFLNKIEDKIKNIEKEKK